MKHKTILLLAMPGMGKTTLVNQLNYGLSMDRRIAVDLDYRAPRISRYDNSEAANLVRSSQSTLINAYAMHGVRLITAFPQGINFSLINRNLIQIVWVFPTNVNELVKRCKQRSMQNGHSVSDFDLEYERCAQQWENEWFQLYNLVQSAQDRMYIVDTDGPNFVNGVVLDILIKEGI